MEIGPNVAEMLAGTPLTPEEREKIVRLCQIQDNAYQAKWEVINSASLRGATETQQPPGRN
jgi:hypothetical protein